MGLKADKRHWGDSRMGVGLRRTPLYLHGHIFLASFQLSLSFLPLSWFHWEARLWKFEKVNKRRGAICLKKQDGERTGTRSDRPREKENKGAGERRGAEWRWLNGRDIVMNRWWGEEKVKPVSVGVAGTHPVLCGQMCGRAAS